MTSHFPDHVFMVSNRVAIMKEGAFVALGRPDDVITASRLEQVYGMPVDIRYIDGPVQRKVCIPITK